jgi:hypothetical protein
MVARGTIADGGGLMNLASRGLFVLSLFLVFSVTAKKAYAEDFDITWSGTYGNGFLIVSATAEASGVFLVTGIISGEQNGQAITALLPVSTFYSNSNDISVIPPQVDGGGLAFAVGSTDYTLYDNVPYKGAGLSIWECTGPPMSGTNMGACNAYGDGFQLASLSITPATAVAPEPSSLILMGSGVVGLGGLFRRKLLLPFRAGSLT